MKARRKIEIEREFPNIKEWRFFEIFYFLPTIITWSTNTYCSKSENYLYTRYVEFWFLWFMIGISWEYGKPQN